MYILNFHFHFSGSKLFFFPFINSYPSCNCAELSRANIPSFPRKNNHPPSPFNQSVKIMREISVHFSAAGCAQLRYIRSSRLPKWPLQREVWRSVPPSVTLLITPWPASSPVRTRRKRYRFRNSPTVAAGQKEIQHFFSRAPNPLSGPAKKTALPQTARGTLPAAIFRYLQKKHTNTHSTSTTEHDLKTWTWSTPCPDSTKPTKRICRSNLHTR